MSKPVCIGSCWRNNSNPARVTHVDTANVTFVLYDGISVGYGDPAFATREVTLTLTDFLKKFEPIEDPCVYKTSRILAILKDNYLPGFRWWFEEEIDARLPPREIVEKKVDIELV